MREVHAVPTAAERDAAHKRACELFAQATWIYKHNGGVETDEIRELRAEARQLYRFYRGLSSDSSSPSPP